MEGLPSEGESEGGTGGEAHEKSHPKAKREQHLSHCCTPYLQAQDA